MKECLNSFRLQRVRSARESEMSVCDVWAVPCAKSLIGSFLCAQDLVACSLSSTTHTHWDSVAEANGLRLGWTAGDDADCTLQETGCVSWKQRLYYLEEPYKWRSWSARMERQTPQRWTFANVCCWSPRQLVLNFAIGLGDEFLLPPVACNDEDLDTCRVLRARGADFREGLVYWRGDSGEGTRTCTPASVDFLKWLVDVAKADPNSLNPIFLDDEQLDGLGPTLYEIVTWHGTSDFADVLPYLCQVTDLQLSPSHGHPVAQTVLHLACFGPNIPALVELLLAGAKVKRDPSGARPTLSLQHRADLVSRLADRAFDDWRLLAEFTWV